MMANHANFPVFHHSDPESIRDERLSIIPGSCKNPGPPTQNRVGRKRPLRGFLFPQSRRGRPSYTACYCCRFFLNQSSHRRPLAPRAPVVYHRCKGGCSSGKINVFIFRDVYPHRPSPMSILIRLFSLFSAPQRLRAMPKSPRAGQIAVENRSHSSCRGSPLWEPSYTHQGCFLYVMKMADGMQEEIFCFFSLQKLIGSG